MPETHDQLKEGFKKNLDQAEWAWFKPHVERDALIWVSPDLDILEVALALAEDSTSQVQAWISGGKVLKLTPDQKMTWDQEPTRKFLTLIVQPYVLIQHPSLN